MLYCLGVISQVKDGRNHFASFFNDFYLEAKAKVSEILYDFKEFNESCNDVGYGKFQMIFVGQQPILNDVTCGWEAIHNLLKGVERGPYF